MVGPQEPIELDTFLEPMVSELLQLHAGVPTYDAYTRQNFALQAHLILVIGDSPAIAKVLHLSGHNGFSPCRFCTIKGTPYQKKYKKKNGDVERLKTTHYYPLTPPTDIPPNRNVSRAHHTYDSNNLPNRTIAGFIADAQKPMKVMRQPQRQESSHFQSYRAFHRFAFRIPSQ